MHGPNPTSIDAIPAFELGNGRHLLQQEFARCTLDHGKIGKPHVNAGFGNYNREQGWKDYVEADGTIRSTPRGRGHYWGPV
jgi:hypothetical protein